MNAGTGYTTYHPRWYRRRVSVWWWLQKGVYAFFVFRELTSLAVAYFAVIFLWMLRAIACCAASYEAFLNRMQQPLWIFFNSVALLFIVFHTITWLNLAPKAMAVRFAGKRVPDRMIQAANYAAWIAATVAVIWLSQRG